MTKPFKNDLVSSIIIDLLVTFKCYTDSNELLEEDTIRNYLKRIRLCKGVIKAIMNMRLNEKAKLTIYPKYGCMLSL